MGVLETLALITNGAMVFTLGNFPNGLVHPIPGKVRVGVVVVYLLLFVGWRLGLPYTLQAMTALAFTYVVAFAVTGWQRNRQAKRNRNSAK